LAGLLGRRGAGNRVSAEGGGTLQASHPQFATVGAGGGGGRPGRGAGNKPVFFFPPVLFSEGQAPRPPSGRRDDLLEDRGEGNKSKDISKSGKKKKKKRGRACSGAGKWGGRGLEKRGGGTTQLGAIVQHGTAAGKGGFTRGAGRFGGRVGFCGGVYCRPKRVVGEGGKLGHNHTCDTAGNEGAARERRKRGRGKPGGETK